MTTPERLHDKKEVDDPIAMANIDGDTQFPSADMCSVRQTTSSDSKDRTSATVIFTTLSSDDHSVRHPLFDMAASIHHLTSGNMLSEEHVNNSVPKSDPVPYSTLPVEIGLRTLSGQKEISIDLSPKELGLVNITISVDTQAQTHVSFLVEQPQTLAMLKHDAPHIRNALEQAGIQIPDTGLSFNLSQDNPSYSGNSGQERGHPQKQPATAWPQSIHEFPMITSEDVPVYQRVQLKQLDLSV